MNIRIYREWVKFMVSLDVDYSLWCAYSYRALYVMLFVFMNWESIFKDACPHTAIKVDLLDVNINDVISTLKDEAKHVDMYSDETIVILNQSLVKDLKMWQEKHNKKV